MPLPIQPSPPLNRKLRKLLPTALGLTRTIARHRRVLFEPLEDRCVLASELLMGPMQLDTGLSASLDLFGNLLIADYTSNAVDNQLTVSRHGDRLVVHDPVQSFDRVPAVGVLSQDSLTLTIPWQFVSGQLIVRANGGDDTLVVDLTNGDAVPARGIVFEGGPQATSSGDSLVITGGDQGTVTYNYLNAHDGDVVMSNYGTITYTGLEPITNSGTAADVVFNLPAATNVATLADDGLIGNGLSRLSAATFETTNFSNPTNSLTINRGSGSDTLSIDSLPDLTSGIVLGSGTAQFNTITFNGTISLGANRNLAAFAAGTISFPNTFSDVSTSGAGAISLTSNRNIQLSALSSVVAVDGAITLSANMQTPASTTGGKGIELLNAAVRTTGSGTVTVEGRGATNVAGSHGVHVHGSSARITSGGGNVRVTGFGGGSGTAQLIHGVVVSGAGQIFAGGTGTTTVEGTGGNLTGSGDGNIGVQTTGGSSRITSASGNVFVTGTGGGLTGANGFGVSVEAGSSIFAGSATATTTIAGFGGGLGGSGSHNMGVSIGGGNVTSSGGNVIVTGTGGGSGTSFNSIGVEIVSGGITAGGNGTVTVNGTGGNASGGNNSGVRVWGSVNSGGGNVTLNGTAGGSAVSDNDQGVALLGGTITVGAGGSVTINGTGGSGSGVNNHGFYAQGSPSILRGDAGGLTINGFAPNTAAAAVFVGTNVAVSTLSTGDVTIAADRLSISSTINAGANAVTLKPTTAGKTIDLGGNDSPTVLGLSDDELDRITAGTLIVGDFSLAPINVTGPVTRPTATNVLLNAGNALTFVGGSIHTAGGALQLASNGTSGVGTRPNMAGVEVTASTTSLMAGTPLEINISGTTVDTNYQQLSVVGNVNLNGGTLLLTGSYVPALVDQFVIVNNDGTDPVTGTFAGLPENAIVTINGVQKRITYVGGTGNDVVLWTPNIAPIITSNGGGPTASLSVVTGTTAVTTVTATDADIPPQTLTYSLVGGADQARFTIDGVTGVLRFVSAPDYANPLDVGANNVYDVMVQVADGLGGIDTQAIAVTVTDLPPVNNLLPVSGHRDLIYDSVRQQLLVTTSSGALLRFDEATGSFISPIALGTNLNGGDITADGNFVYVTEEVVGATQGTIHKANLSTGAITNLTYPNGASEQGSKDLNIASNGLAFFTTSLAGSGSVPLRQIEVATDVISTAIQSFEDMTIARGADRSLLYFQFGGSSGGPVFMYTTPGGFANVEQTFWSSGSNLATVSRNGSLIAWEMGSNVAVFDRNYLPIEQFGRFEGGILFHPTQDLLLAVDAGADQIIALDTVTWKERYRVPIGENVGASSHLGPGVMAVGGNGSTLYLSTVAGIRMITLPMPTGVVAAPGLSDYGTYVLAGSAVNLTVTMRDPSGAVVPGYTGTIQFTSNDPAAALPSNYTFTLSDAGKKTFTFTPNTAGSRTVTVTDTGTASITGTTASITVHTTPSTLLPITGPRDLVFDSVRNQLLVTTSTGLVQRYDVASDSLLSPFQVSHSLNSADTNLTQSALYIQEGIRNATQGMIRKVDLTTGAQTAITYENDGSEGAGWDIAITGNNLAFSTSRYEGSGGVALRQINLATDAITTVGGVNQDTHLSRSANRSRMFLMQSNISSGPTSQYSVASGFTTNRQSSAFLDDVMSAISPDGSLIAMELGGNTVVFTSAWQAVEQLGGFNGGMIFHPTQNLLLAVDQTNDQVVAFDTTTWRERYRLAIGEDVGTSGPLVAGQMAVSADGSRLFLSTGSGVRVFVLPAATGVTANILLSNYGLYVNAGAPHSLTVTMRDPAGNVVPNYTGTVQFTSSDPAALLPPNYTFTLADAGQKTFNVTFNTAGSRAITVTDATNGSLTSTTSAITVHSTPTTLLPIAGARDLVFDSLRNVLYVTTASGFVQRYHVGSDSLLAPFNVSDSLLAADITANNGALYLQEGLRNLSQRMVRKIDLTTGAFSNLTYDGAVSEGGGWDLAIAADGMAYFTNTYEGSSAVPFRRIDVATDAVGVVPGRTSVQESTLITRSANRNRLFLQESDITSGPTFMYSVPGGFSPTVDSWTFNDFNQVAINADGSRIAMEYRGSVVIFDETYHALEQLGGYNGGVAFHPTQNLLLTVNDSTDQLVAFDTTTWKERFRLPIGENVGASTPLGAGTMIVSPDGTKLFMITGSGVRVITLPSPTGVATRVDVSGYGTYLNANTPASMTVTIRDPAGNVVPNYTGTIQFSSTDVTAGLPGNYTFTLADAGERTFTFTLATAGTRTVTVTDTLQPSLTSTTANIAVHTTLTTVIPVTGPRDLVYDAARNILYISTSSGQIQRYGVAQDSLLTPFNVSHNLYALDTSPVNGAIYAAEGISNIAEGMVRKVNPDTGSVTNVTFPGGGADEGGFDFNIGVTGLGLLTGRYAGSGSVALHRIATATDTVTAPTDIWEFAHVFRNDTRTMLGSVEGSISSGPLRIYDPATGTVTATLNRFTNVDRAFMAINPSGTLVALANHANFVEIYSPTLSLITTIPNVRGSAIFKPGTNLLYVADSFTDTIQVYNGDNAWAFVESFPSGEALETFGMGNLGVGTMAFAPGGNRLFMIVPSGVRMYITGDITPPTASSTPANQTILENTNTGPLGFTVGDNVTAAGNLVVSATSSNTTLIPNANLFFGGSGANRTITATPTANHFGGPVTITVTVTDEALNSTQFSFTVTVTPTTFRVVNFTPTATGYVLEFNRDLNPATLNLYDTQSGIGPSDLVLQPATSGALPVRGSAIIDPSLRKLTFVATTGTLPVDSYTLTLRSATDGFVDSTAALLDGDINGAPGGNYVHNFSVTTPPVNAVTIHVPNFARGPQQAVNLPAIATTGIPLSFSDGDGLTSARFNLRYDPALLTITGGAIAPGLPAGAAVSVTITQPGIADVLFTSTNPLPPGTTRFVDLQANVPASATYRQKNLLDISDIVLSGGRPAIDDDGVHLVAYFGDATGNGTYSSQDASRVARIAVGLDGGLTVYKLVDPIIVADLTGNGAISSTDTSRVLQIAVGFNVAEVPPLSSPAVSLVQGGPDPKLSIPRNLSALPGESLVIPVEIDSIVDLTGNGLESADLVIYYDAARIDLTSVSLGHMFAQGSGQWTIVSRVEPLAGRIFISLAGVTPLEGFFAGELLQLQAIVKADAAPGPTAINLAASSRDPSRFTQLNEGYLTLIPAPTDAADDDVDGVVMIQTESSASSLASQVQFVGNQLIVAGTSGNDRVFIGHSADHTIAVRINRSRPERFPLPDAITALGFDAKDRLIVASGLNDRVAHRATSEDIDFALLQWLTENEAGTRRNAVRDQALTRHMKRG